MNITSNIAIHHKTYFVEFHISFYLEWRFPLHNSYPSKCCKGQWYPNYCQFFWKILICNFNSIFHQKENYFATSVHTPVQSQIREWSQKVNTCSKPTIKTTVLFMVIFKRLHCLRKFFSLHQKLLINLNWFLLRDCIQISVPILSEFKGYLRYKTIFCHKVAFNV